MHLLLWIENSLTPQEMQDKLLDDKSSFNTELIQYLESLYQGEFIDKSLEEVKEDIDCSEDC